MNKKILVGIAIAVIAIAVAVVGTKTTLGRQGTGITW